MNIEAALNFNDIPEKSKAHLTRVYSLLSAMILAAVLGKTLIPVALVHSLWFVFLIVNIGLIFYLVGNRGYDKQTEKGAAALSIAFIDGAFVGPLVDHYAEINPAIVVNALVYTMAIFVSFSLFSLVTKRRSMLFLGGFLSSAVSMMFFAQIISMVFGMGLTFSIGYNIIGVWIFALYVIFDTQMIIEKSARGDIDVAGHALELFVDLVQILIKILKILGESEKKKRKD